ncbi:unnamed protein product [Adineta ricciae]|uniref:Uncharacterized protein n=1 Tax=Adineta ricciae TaxID=249248 RepID=A0A813QHP3_ADIRI|nr:unnamed protein product [Adineta ricciae]CAF1283434.1 unnamed protein product [Adineta ricciae]
MVTIAVMAPIMYNLTSGAELTCVEQQRAEIAVQNELVISAEKMRKYIQMHNRFIVQENNYDQLWITLDSSKQTTLNIIGHCEDFGIVPVNTKNPIITPHMLSYMITQFLIANTHVTQVRLFVCLAAPSFLNELVTEVIRRLSEYANDTNREIKFIAPQGLSYTHKRTEVVLHDVPETIELLGQSSSKEERRIVKKWTIYDETAYMIITVNFEKRALINRQTTYAALIR